PPPAAAAPPRRPTTSSRPARRAYDRAAPTRRSSSYTSACTAPERSADPAPHSTKPAANAGYDGNSTHSPKPAPASRGEAASSDRRENTSAHRPDGSSSANVVTDQITNNDEIAAGESPASANSTAYTGYSRTKSWRNA